MSFELREHTADVAIEATADSIGGVFAAVAEGLTAAMCDSWPDGGDRFSFEVRSENREALLFDYLDGLIYERDVRGVLPVDHDCTVREPSGKRSETDSRPESGSEADPNPEHRRGGRDEWVAEASARGVPFADVQARDVKAVTYSEMRLEERAGGWYAYVVVDV